MVIHVVDGDTLTALNEANEHVKIRLNGIDCPEKVQAFGNKAKQCTKDLVSGKMGTIQPYDTDRYGRTIAEVILEDGRNLNQELVKAGLAWWYFKYSDDEQLGMLEVKAKIGKIGLWKDKNPMPPWIFRHRNEPTTLQPNPLETPSTRLVTPPNLSTSLPILGNRRSHKFHRPDCPSYGAISPKNRVPSPSPQDAEQAVYTLAGNCGSVANLVEWE
jgi:endonuclease YncB( thermonuclease family)